MKELENKLLTTCHLTTKTEQKQVLLSELKEEFAFISGVIRASDKTFQDAFKMTVVQEAESGMAEEIMDVPKDHFFLFKLSRVRLSFTIVKRTDTSSGTLFKIRKVLV